MIGRGSCSGSSGQTIMAAGGEAAGAVGMTSPSSTMTSGDVKTVWRKEGRQPIRVVGMWVWRRGDH
jgi:hypothetical protein